MSKLLAMMMNKKYTRLEYIETHTEDSNITGSFLDTLYTPTLNTRVRVKFMPLKFSINFSRAGYFGARNDPYRFCCTTFSTGTKFTFSVTNNTWSNNQTNLNEQIYDCIAENGKQIINGTEYNETLVENWGDCGHFLLGKIVTSSIDAYSNGRYYSCQIWESGILVMDLVPVIRNSDNEIGMLDRVSGQFFGNAGTGKFRVPNEVGYTVVGNPTIVDGVVSGFSGSNYLKTAQNFPLQPTNFEINVKIKNETSDSNIRYVVGGQSRTSFIVSMQRNAENTFTFTIYGGNADGTSADWYNQSNQITLSETNWIYLKFKFNGKEYALYVSQDNINYAKVASYTTTQLLYGNAPIFFGRWASGDTAAFNGSIDLNSTNIKINNKLWFNGQQA